MHHFPFIILSLLSFKFHILIIYNTNGQIGQNFVGMIFVRSIIKMPHFILIRKKWPRWAILVISPDAKIHVNIHYHMGFICRLFT